VDSSASDEALAALGRLYERCPGLLDHVREQICQHETRLEESILESSAPNWKRADVVAALIGLASVGALAVERVSDRLGPRRYSATNLLDVTMDRVAAVARVLPTLRKYFDQEHQASLVVSWPPALQGPRFRRWRSSKLTLVEMIDDAGTGVTLVFPFVDAEGVDEIAGALERALARDVRVVLLTRYLTTSSSPNAQLAARLKGVASADHFQALNISTEGDSGRELLHAKVLIIDNGRRGYVGSANLTRSAFGESVEIGVALEGAAAASVAELIDDLLVWARSA